MSEELAPPVVAVVVSHDPGTWLEPCLQSLREQDYPNLSVLVVDAASEPPLAPRVAEVAPGFYIRRLEENRGFGPSANSVRGVIEGATHLLFCHDDIVLSSDAIRRMVEEAFRQNAGIVGPKLVDPDEPDHILQLGLGVDRFGAPVRRVERREFDQAQHDEVQETFAIPGGCTLVRADLFDAIDGFDEEISMFGEDVDLCWRARLAGARAFVVPQAVVAHMEATSARRRELREARALQWRHELRVVLKNYGRLRRTIVLSELAVWSFAEICYFLVLGRPDRARQVRDAWRWNLQSARHLPEARARVRRDATHLGLRAPRAVHEADVPGVALHPASRRRGPARLVVLFGLECQARARAAPARQSPAPRGHHPRRTPRARHPVRCSLADLRPPAAARGVPAPSVADSLDR